MAMKPIAVFILVAAVSVATVAATAKTVNSSQNNSDDRTVSTLAGPAEAANGSHKVPDRMASTHKKPALHKIRTAQMHKPTPVRTTD
jgi:hypothetical protein